MTDVSGLSDADLRQKLISLGQTPGPVTPATRVFFEKKLVKLIQEQNGTDVSKTTPKRKASPKKTPSSARSRSSSKTRSQNEVPVIDEPEDRPRPKSPGRPPKNTTPLAKPTVPSAPKPTPVSPSPPRQNVSTFKPITPPKTSSFKRTPTPTRPTYQKNRSSPSVIDSNIFDGFKNNDASYSQAEDEDDHFESSRLLTPDERLRFTSFGSAKKKTNSPLEKLKSFGSSAVNYLARSDNNYTHHASERGDYGTPGGRYSPVSRRNITRDPVQNSGSDWPKIFLIFFIALTVILTTAYIFTAHSNTIARSQEVVFGTVSELGRFVYNYAIVPTVSILLLIGAVTGLFYFYRANKVRKQQFENDTMLLVDQIADSVRAAGAQGTAENHIRDKVYPPTRRTQKQWDLWKAAAQFINTTDSRIRSESQLVNGEECNVWIWVTADSESYQTSAQEGPTSCLKIRGLITQIGHEDLAKLKKQVAAKIHPIKFNHYGEDVETSDRAVFMAFDNKRDSFVVYNKLQGKVVNGKEIVAKYMTEDRYQSRFPNWQD